MKRWWKWWREWWRERWRVGGSRDRQIGCRVPGVPTSDELAASAAGLREELDRVQLALREARAENLRLRDGSEAAREQRRAEALLRQLDEARAELAKRDGDPGASVADGRSQRLLQLAEECAEVSFAVAKALLYGMDSATGKGARFTRRTMLEREIGDVLCAVDACAVYGDLRWKEIRGWQSARVAPRPASANGESAKAK